MISKDSSLMHRVYCTAGGIWPPAVFLESITNYMEISNALPEKTKTS